MSDDFMGTTRETLKESGNGYTIFPLADERIKYNGRASRKQPNPQLERALKSEAREMYDTYVSSKS